MRGTHVVVTIKLHRNVNVQRGNPESIDMLNKNRKTCAHDRGTVLLDKGIEELVDTRDRNTQYIQLGLLWLISNC